MTRITAYRCDRCGQVLDVPYVVVELPSGAAWDIPDPVVWPSSWIRCNGFDGTITDFCPGCATAADVRSMGRDPEMMDELEGLDWDV